MLNDIKNNCDFEGWVIKYGVKSINGRIYQKDSILCDAKTKIVPLVWSHRHCDPEDMLGYALIENRDEGIYTYCKLIECIERSDIVRQLINTRGSVSFSPFITQAKFDGDYIVGGNIREVSLVLTRVDPDEAYYPVPTTSDNEKE